MDCSSRRRFREHQDLLVAKVHPGLTSRVFPAVPTGLILFVRLPSTECWAILSRPFGTGPQPYLSRYRLPVKRRAPPPIIATTPRMGGNGTVLVSFFEA